jgi:uncharacterized repeat protein (TIGR01451 family)
MFAVADFNNDRKADIVELTNGYLYVFLGNADGTFQPYTSAYTPIADAIAVCDMNGDGKADILTADSSGVNVLLGNGDGTFQSPIHQAAGAESPALFCADANGDGRLDAIALNTAGDLANVLLGNGDGSLQPPINYPVGAAPRGLVAADFNGDGATDIAVANSQGSSVSILFGIPVPLWQISSSHIDPFGLGETGASYTITVTNAGPGSTAGLVTLSDTLPAVFTSTAISGTGWTCTLAGLTCTRSDSLSAGASYPPVAIAVNVPANAPASATNQATVSGGSAVAATAADPTTIVSGGAVTIQTVPNGLQFTIDGGALQTAPRTRYLNLGNHTISVATTQAGNPGTQYVFTGWSDSGAATHTISVGSASATYNATFQTQYLLSVQANPEPGGTVSPVSGTYFDAASSVNLTATPNPPYLFTSWSGGVTGSANPASITMSGPLSAIATFNVPGFTCAITGDNAPSVAGVQLIINEALGVSEPSHDMNRDGVVNVADVQKVTDAVMGIGCIY